MSRVVLKRKVFVGLTLILLIYIVHLLFKATYHNKNNKIDFSKPLNQVSNRTKFRSWIDQNQIKVEALRKGLGENGKDVYLSDPEEIALNNELYQKTGDELQSLF
jgi:hypothetical protein